MDGDVAPDEVHLRRNLGDQFDLAIQATVGDMMDEEEQNIKTRKEPVVDQDTVQLKDSDSSSVEQVIDITIIEEQSQLLKLYALEVDKLVSTQKIGESSSVAI